MLKRLVKINGVGQYVKFNAHRDHWDGDLGKQTLIFGENGTGKTTLSIILKSLAGNDNLVKKKKSFGYKGEQDILFLDESGVPYQYTNGKWSNHNANIEIFDTHFIEENIYTGSLHNLQSQSGLFELILGEEGIKRRRKLDELYAAGQTNRKTRRALKRKLLFQNPPLTKDTKQYFEAEIQKLDDEYRDGRKYVIQAQKELGEISRGIFETYISTINEKLAYFSPYIEIKKLSKTFGGPQQRISYHLLVNNHQVGFVERQGQHSVKYTLSEGDKSAVAFAFFLAKLTTQGNSENKIIVFDDPISSFDYARRNSTINQLANLARSCKQLIILSHDIAFISELSKKLSTHKPKNLKIARLTTTNALVNHDIEKEMLSPVFKDINVLSRYLEFGAPTDEEKREVIRCLRPILEGILRIKFFRDIKNNEWLGDMIKKIRDAKSDERLARLQAHLSDIEEINDYTKSYHHADPTSMWGYLINDQELRIYVNRTLKLIEII